MRPGGGGDDVKKLRSLWGGFWSSRVVLTANNLGIFEPLKSRKSATEVAALLKTDPRATEILLDALAGLGLLKKSSGRYRNAPLATRFLTRASPHYQGDIMRHADALWKNWSNLDTVVRTGNPCHASHDHAAFIRGMDNLAALKVKRIIHAIRTKGVKRALDLGGGPGTYAIEMARRGISVTIFDLPETIKIAKEVVKESRVKGVGFREGDFHTDAIGQGYDLVLISQVLHSCAEEMCERIIGKSRDALNASGRIAIQEFFLDETRSAPPQSALFSVNMLINTEGGRCYTPAEMTDWLKRSGFSRITRRLIDDSVLIFGQKL